MSTQEVPPPLQRVLDVVKASGRVVKQTGRLQHLVQCVAHDDDEPSLSIGMGDNGAVVLHCQAGCDTADVLDALGLKWSDLQQPSEVDSIYPYEDEDGELVYEVVRYRPKSFRQRRPNPDNPRTRVWDMKGIEPIPFRLLDVAELVAHGTDEDEIWITEGEKDVLAMIAAYGATATCNSGGAGKWIDAHSQHFVGFKGSVTIVADRDVAGYKHALKVYDSLLEVAGITAEIVQSAVGKDAADHCGDYGLEDFEPLTLAEVTALKNSGGGVTTSVREVVGATSESRLILRPASEIKSRLQKFLWHNRIPLGAVALFAGRGGVGKSSFAIWLAVEAQHGRLPGDLQGEHITVLYVSVEDHWETQMKPRLIAAGAKMGTFYQLSIGYTTDEATGERIPSLPEDTPLIRDAIEQTGASLVILDPITSSIQGDDHKRDVVRAVLDPLAQIAGETDSVILGIMHFNKGTGNVSDKVSGSHAYRDAARAVMMFARDEDEGHVVMSQDKGNYAEYDDVSLAYRLVNTVVELDDGGVGEVARVEIVGDTNVSVSQIINRPQGEDNEIVDWLTAFMAANDGRVSAQEGLEAGREAGFSKDQLTRARKRCRPKVDSQKDAGMNAGWVWVTEESDKKAVSAVSAFFSESGGVGSRSSEEVGSGEVESLSGQERDAVEERASTEESERELIEIGRKRRTRTQPSSAHSSGIVIERLPNGQGTFTRPFRPNKATKQEMED